MLEINPSWGVQKIFQHYRAGLTALCDGRTCSKPAIAEFREANIGVEQRLRSKLPSRMGPIDAIYQSVGLEPGSSAENYSPVHAEGQGPRARRRRLNTGCDREVLPRSVV